MNRRHFMGLAGGASVAAGLSILGCDNKEAGKPAESGSSGGGSKDFAGQTLRVFVYSGSWEKGTREVFVPLFEKKTGAKVVVDPGWWDSIPKLKASPKGQPAFDLVLTDATQGYPAIKEGMFGKLDMSKIPNKSQLVPSALDNWVVKDSYGITFPDSPMTLGWNKTLVTGEPTAWGDLLKDDYKGKLGMYNSFYMSLYTFACMKATAEGKAGQAASMISNDLQGCIDFAKANRDRVKYWWPTSTDMAQNLAAKNCSIGNMHGGDMVNALRSSQDLGAIVPDKDRGYVLLMWVIPADTKKADLAHEAINLILGEEVQTGFAKVGGATASPKVAAKIAAEDKTWARIMPKTAESLAGIQYYPYDTYMAHWDDIVKVWDREVLRKG